MKVLQINSVCGIGSTGRIATDLAQVLETEGHESYIAYGRDSGVQEHVKIIKIGSKIDNYLHVAKTRIFDRHGFGSKKATLAFVEEIKKLNPDVIHLHNLHGYYLNIEVLFNFLKEFNKRVIWTLHDCWAFTGHCSYFDFADCDKWKTECHNCPQKLGYPTSVMKDESKRNFMEKKSLFTGVKNLTIVTPSQWLADLVKESFLSVYPVKVINNGIDLNIFKPVKGNFRRKYQLKNKFMILGVASVWGTRKGLQYFIELSKGLDSDEVIVLVGLTKVQMRRLPINIIGIEKTNSVQELAEIYSTADVFVNPTLEDNFPTTNLEALGTGTPVVTFSTGGSIESIDETCGIVVGKRNLSELYHAITNIKGSTISRDDCIERSKQYDKNTKFKEYLKIYQDS